MTPENARSRRRWLLPLLVAPFFVLAVAHLVAPDSALLLIWAGSATVWVFVPAWALLPVSLHRRDLLATFLCGFVVTCHAVWVGPTLIASASAAPATAPRMRIVKDGGRAPTTGL